MQKGSERCDMRTPPVIAGSEDGGRGHRPRSVGGLQELEKARKWILP